MTFHQSDWQNPIRRNRAYFGHTDNMVLTAKSPVAPPPPPPANTVHRIFRPATISNSNRRTRIEFGHTNRMRMPVAISNTISSNVNVQWVSTANNMLSANITLTDVNGHTAAVLTLTLNLKP